MCIRDRTEFLLDLTRDACCRVFAAFEEAGDQPESACGPGMVARQDDTALMLDQRRQHWRRVVPVHETATGATDESRQSPLVARFETGAAAGAELPGVAHDVADNANDADNSRASCRKRSTVSGAVSQPHIRRAPPAPMKV